MNLYQSELGRLNIILQFEDGGFNGNAIQL